MLNPYPDRLDELHRHLECYWGQKDRQATEIILAGALSGAGSPGYTTRLKPLWLVIETDYSSEHMENAWFGFNDELAPLHFSSFRVKRAHAEYRILRQLLSERHEAKLFIESEWRRLPSNGGRARRVWGKGMHLGVARLFPALLANSVHLRVVHPRGGLPGEPEYEELGRLARRVLDHQFREALPRLPSPQGLLYWCELAQKVCGFQTDWDTYVRSIDRVSQSFALLHGTPDVNQAAWLAAERVLRDTIPHPVEWMLLAAGTPRAQGIKNYQAYRGSGAYMHDVLIEEMKRLIEEGVLECRQNYHVSDSYVWHPWRYRVTRPEFRELLDRGKRILA